MPSRLPFRSAGLFTSGEPIITTLSLGAYVPMALTGAPCWMAAKRGSELVATTSRPPEMPPRSAPTPPSKLLISTSRPTSSKKPMSLATYGARWTMLGGVTAPPKIMCILSVGVAAAAGALVGAAAGAVGLAGAAGGAGWAGGGVGHPVLPAGHNNANGHRKT